tara:strand:- start:707 stop:892 length:186 start_codon:yes stop_codon:yes gene_type:complete
MITHSFLTAHAIRDGKGRFTGRYRLSFDVGALLPSGAPGARALLVIAPLVLFLTFTLAKGL